jgi:crotonobetainyl-CoA:carnitine CoA-transferase CaiB-like acyl-CoA transferase
LSAGPLDGIQVLDLSRLLPGGYATMMMADLGADVIKIEEPGKGDYVRWMPPFVGEVSSGHIALNRNKRSITLNLKTDQGRAAFTRLVGAADVLVESFRPGVMTRLGVGWGHLNKVNPRLIYCSISGYGQDGPRAEVAGHDIDYIGYSGILSLNGAEGGPPVVPGLQIGDLAGGGMAAVIAVLAALVRRGATGEGDHCDVSMTDGAFSWLSIHAAQFQATGEVPQRALMPLSGTYPCYRVYPASDGWLSVGALEPQFWAALCAALDREDLLDDGFATGERRAEVISELETLFSSRSRAEWMESFGDRDVCVAPVNDLAEAFEDPQLRHRSMIVESEVPGVGRWEHIGNPIKLSGAPGRVDRLPPPRIGEHTDEVLGSAGFSSQEIEDLRGSGAI